MNTLFSKRFIAFLAILLTVVLATTLCFTLTKGISVAGSESAPTPESSLVIGHVSDIHYFPLEHCYRKVDSPDYEDSDFFYSLTGDTKLVLESGMTLNKTIKSIIEDAKAGIAPHYFVASGDLSKNGERVSLIDVANALRYLQNEVRTISGYGDFQVFATTGNHDLYNPDGAIYSTEDGKHHDTDVVSAAQFALIFAGLGYPDANLTGADGAINLTEYMPAEYWSSEYTSGYQASKNSSDIKINYFSPILQSAKALTDPSERLEAVLGIGDGINVLSFSAELTAEAQKGYSFLIIDSSDRTQEDVGTIVALGKNEYESYASTDTDHIIFLEDANGDIDTSKQLTKKKNSSAIAAAFDAGKRVFRATKFKHLTGGRITEECLDWMQDYCETQTGDKTTLGEETVVTVCHQNALPHFDQEDDILKDFTLYNWEYTSRRLLAMGSRYVLTGHMHASDVMTYTDEEGRTLYDFETGSIVSYASPHRYITIERKNCGGKLGEKTISTLHTLDNLKEIASIHIADAPAWNQAAFDAATTLEAKLASNPDYEMYVRRYDMLSTCSYDDYTTIDIYSRLLDRAVNHFLSERMMGSLKKTVKNLLVGDSSKLVIKNKNGGTMLDLSDYGPALYGVAEYAIDSILYGLYEDGYPYDGQKYDSAVEYLKAIVFKFAATEFGDASITCASNPANSGKMTIHDLVTCISTAHAQGTEIKLCLTDAELQAEYAYIDEHFTDTDCSKMSQTDKLKAFKQPVDKTYRKRMTAAIKDLHEWCTSGRLVEYLLDTLLEPLYYDDNSLLKTLVDHKFDFSKAVNKAKHDNPSEVYLTAAQYEDIESLFNLVSSPAILNMLSGFLDVDITITDNDLIKADNLVLSRIINELMPIVKELAAKLIGFNLSGDTFTQVIDNALHGYLTESFNVGIGGIIDNIIVAYATDVYPDVTDMSDLDKPFIVQPYVGFAYGGEQMTYAEPKLAELRSRVGGTFNAATQLNGRVPSHLTSAFDTANPTTGYTVKFYTAEDVYANFKIRLAGEDHTWRTIGTEEEFRVGDTSFASVTFENGIRVEIVTQTKPQYVPLIDLGLAALTHGQVEDDDDVPYVYPARDVSSGNSIIYWNVTTVKVTGLSPDTAYEYDVEGTYKTSNGETLTFSLADFAGVPATGFTMKTAKAAEATSFEFLTIADIQGMIQGMYSNSYKAVEALLADDRTKNFDFIINAGDMVDNGKNFAQWGYALNTYQPLFANYSQFFTAGNHEGKTYGMTNFFDYALPKDADDAPLQEDVLGGVFYSFDYANAHFVVLNTNDASTNGLGTVQYNWLKNDLEKSTKKWKFVLMHKSLFSGGSHSYDGEVIAMRAQLVPLFAETGVNIVFAGHDHTYTSTLLIDKDGNATDKQDLKGIQYTGDGVLYITLGTMGTKYYEYGENPNVTPKFDDDKSILHTLDSQTFGRVVVTDDMITFTGYYFDRSTNSIKVVGESELSAKPIFDKKIAIALAVVIPVVAVAGAGVGITLGVLKKKGKLGKKTAE